MKKNFFTAALESNDNPATVDIATIIQPTQQDLEPKPGVGKGDEVKSDDEIKFDKAFGELSVIAEHDEIDTVAESQEHTLALEQLQAAAFRFCRMGAALEEISETAEANLDAGEPMDPSTVSMITTAIDAGGVGEPMADSVALETFDFSPQVATEGFVEELKSRAKKVWIAVAKFARKSWEVTTQKLKRFADFFRGLPGIYAKLEKEGAILATNSGKPFQNSKWEKAVQEHVCAPSSTKTLQAAVANAQSEFEDIQRLVNGKIAGDIQGLKAAWKTEKAESVVAQMNKVLAGGRQLAEVGQSRWKHASDLIEVNLPERVTLANTGGLEGTKISYEDNKGEFTAGLKTATMAEIKALSASAERADNALKAAWNTYMNAAFSEEDDGMQTFYDAMERGSFKEEDRATSRKLLVKYSNLMRLMSDLVNGSVYSVANGLYQNHFAATRWVRFSIAEAKAAARG